MKNKCLILGTLLILLAGLLGYASIVKAETTLTVFAKSSGSGYEPGIGVGASHLHRFLDHFALGISGSVTNQKKNNADKGYTYGLRGHGRYYFTDFNYSNFYVLGGYGIGGYKSEFDNGKTWEKSAWWPNIGGGYDGAIFDLELNYYPKENQTHNKVEAASIKASMLMTEHFKLIGTYSYQQYQQSGKTESDDSISIGVGWQF